jgi:hypothetical protein
MILTKDALIEHSNERRRERDSVDVFNEPRHFQNGTAAYVITLLKVSSDGISRRQH